MTKFPIPLASFLALILGVGCANRQTLPQAAAPPLASDSDIVSFAEAHAPKGYPIKYGDVNMVLAVKGLSDIPRPWELTQMLARFRQESDAWLRHLKKQREANETEMWPTSDEESRRCGYLATVIAASRDPRAALELARAFSNPDFPDLAFVADGLYTYFVFDPRYKHIELPEGPEAYTNFYPEEFDRVRRWLALNLQQIKREVHEMKAMTATKQ